jgi:hypothetical protein
MPMCILCVALFKNARAASRRYQHLYPDWRQHNRYGFAKVHCSLRETGAFMPIMYVDYSRCNVQIGEELNVVPANPLSSICGSM